jgi:hypothetical protein
MTSAHKLRPDRANCLPGTGPKTAWSRPPIFGAAKLRHRAEARAQSYQRLLWNL